MIRRPPRSTPFPTRRSSDLCLASEQADKVAREKIIEVLFTIYEHDLQATRDRKSTRLNSSHVRISYAVFCLKKKNKTWHTVARNCQKQYGECGRSTVKYHG